MIAGLASMRALPIAQYPEIAPPVVTVRAFYPGASAEVLEQTVAAPLENQINGVEDMLYMSLELERPTAWWKSRSPSRSARRRPRGAQRQQPRQAGRAAAAGGSAPPGRNGRERLLAFLQVFAFDSPDGRFDDLYAAITSR